MVVYDRADRLTINALSASMVPGLRVEFVVRPEEPLLPAVRRVAGRNHRVRYPVILKTRARGADRRPGCSSRSRCSRQRAGAALMSRAAGYRSSGGPAAGSGSATAQVVLQTVRALDAVWLMSEHGVAGGRIQRLRRFAHSVPSHGSCNGIWAA